MSPLSPYGKLEEENKFEQLTPIQEFYKNKSVFMTGATGFLGKIIIEKLLRCCEVTTIYVLIRSKKGKNVVARLEEIFDDVVFERLKREEPKFRHKIVGVIGDCVLPGLGINQLDRQMLQQNVNVVFHVAATVRFDEKLKLALGINVTGTKSMITLCKELHDLKAFVHVSTAFANCNRQDIDEKFYRAHISGENAVKLAECLDDKTLDVITPQILNEWPNTYTFTKCLAEDLVRTMCKGIPATIFRPAVVIPTYREPVCGWIDNMYGPTGIIVGCGAGLLRVFHVKEENYAELVPVDMCVNALLASAWDVARQTYNEPPIYNYVTSPNNPIRWKEYCELGVEHGAKMPMMKSIWYYRITMSSSRLLIYLLTFLYHTVPAFFMDAGLLLMGKKPRMLQIYRKIHKFSDVIKYFTINRWHFTNSNVTNLWTQLTPDDQKIFYFNMDDLSWSEVINLSIYGIRTYLMKEDPSSIPTALHRMQRLKILHYITIYTIYSVSIYVLYFILSKILL